MSVLDPWWSGLSVKLEYGHVRTRVALACVEKETVFSARPLTNSLSTGRFDLSPEQSDELYGKDDIDECTIIV